MLTKRAIQAFLDRPRVDCRPYKQLTKDQCERLQERLPVQPPIWSKLYLEQKQMFLLGARFGRFAFHADTGMGKTLLSVALVRYFTKLKQTKCTLVLVPFKINKWEWARDIPKHSAQTTFEVLTGSSEHKWKQLLATDAMIVIETYAGLTRMVSQMVTLKKKKGLRKSKLVIDPALLKQLLSMINGLVMDECNVVSNKQSLFTRVCRQISKHAQIVFGLTGTPFGRDPIDLWSQMYIIDQGATMGETLGLFRETFFSAAKNFWGGFDYTFKNAMTGTLNNVLANRSISYEADASTLPALTHIIKKVTLPGDAASYYAIAKQKMIEAHGNYRETQNVFLRMRQISSGFVGYMDDEIGARAQLDFDINPKLEMLISLLDSIDLKHKVLVFHDFIHSGDIISKELKHLGIKHLRLSSKTKDHEALLKQFDVDTKVRVLVMSTAGAYGLNLQVAKYGIFYESPVPVILRKQMTRRFVRQRSAHQKVFLYDLVVKGTVDEQILAFHAQGKSLFDAIIKGEQAW